MFDRSVAAADDLEFLVSPTGTWTFGRAREAIDRIAAELVERHGIGPGDRVGFISANSAEYGLAMWAALSIGAIITSLNGWWTADEIRYGIDLTTPSIVLGDVRRLERVAQADRASVPVRSLDDLVASSPGAARRVDAAGRGDRRGRSGGDPVHQRHDRPPEGCDVVASQHRRTSR